MRGGLAAIEPVTGGGADTRRLGPKHALGGPPTWCLALLLAAASIATAPAAPPVNEAPPQGVFVVNTPARSDAEKAADERLAKQIQTRLEGDRWILSYQIRPQVQQGVVTLTGNVDTLLAKVRAAQVTQTVPGVRQVHNEILVSLPARDDFAVKDDVRAGFMHAPPLQDETLHITISNGHVILTGVVGSEYEKELAANIAASVPGVQWVENKLRVDLLAPRTDRQITADVQSKLKWDPGLVNPEIRVNVQNGSVRLSGAVESGSAWERALEDAQVAGARAVNGSALAVVPAGHPASPPPPPVPQGQ